MSEDVNFESIKSEEIKFGNNNFLEIAKKRAVTADGENEFISVSRGFFAPNGEKRFRKSIAFPPEQAEHVMNALKNIME